MRGEILNEFTKDRNKNVVDRKLISDVVKLYIQMGLIEAEPTKSSSWRGKPNL